MRIKGALVIHGAADGTMIARKWPKKRSAKQSAAAKARSDLFGLACSLSTHSIPEDVISARFYSAGTMYLPRDILVSAMYGKLVEAK